MRIKITILFMLLFCANAQSQLLKLSGNIKDTSSANLTGNSVLMAIKFRDSTLIGYSRVNKEGFFKTIKIPVDTYLVVISNPNFGDKTYFLVAEKKDSVINLKNIMLPPKSVMLNEVEIVAYKDKMYYKGDTLIFTADSFKVKSDATVEDLLKKLPGVKVDAKGKITVQGKEVTQVLVDGDEFFGSDPTVATKNLNANTVENVQVYEKKSENSEGTDETVKVMNLQLKEEAKKGYFGKLSAASDFQKFYEGELLANLFKNKRKISVFGLMANTPKQAFGWDDTYKYGMENENAYSYDSETDSWTSNGDGQKSGIPQSIKGGFYYNDKLNKKTSINTDYTFKEKLLNTSEQTNTQYFLEDTTYNNSQKVSTKTENLSHNFNFKWVQNLDSLTEIMVKPKVYYNTSANQNNQSDDFISAANELTRTTNIATNNSSATQDVNVMLKLTRNFKKKDRQLTVSYQPSYYNAASKSTLNTGFYYYLGQAGDSILLQKRTTENIRTDHNAVITYIEPLNKKFKIETTYNFAHNLNNSNRKTLDFNGIAFDALNTTQSNDFNNTRITNRVGSKLIYDVRKYRIAVGANYRNVFQENSSTTTGQNLSHTFNNILPAAMINFRINQGSNLSLNYNMSSVLPDLRQMQPVIDNTDPNNIRTGNPNLKQQYTNSARLNYYFYKGISDVNLYMGANYNHVMGEISNKTYFDSIGRSVSTPTNINGNYFTSMYLGGGVPIFKRFVKVEYNLSASHNNNVSYINDQVNVTKNTSISPGLAFEKDVDDNEFRIGGNYDYNMPSQTISLQSNKPYYTYELSASFRIKLFKRLDLAADGNYVNNGNRAQGYNINYVIVNASMGYSFLKDKSLKLSFDANDIFNQNISNQRQVLNNKIVDTKTQIIRQYFLLRVVYKFTSQKAKAGEEEDE